MSNLLLRLKSAIIRSPDDDHLRLAYADACDLAGDTERARYVRAVILGNDVNFLAQMNQYMAPHWQVREIGFLLKDHPGTYRVFWRRGFIDEVADVDLDFAQKIADALLSSHPISRLGVSVVVRADDIPIARIVSFISACQSSLSHLRSLHFRIIKFGGSSLSKEWLAGRVNVKAKELLPGVDVSLDC